MMTRQFFAQHSPWRTRRAVQKSPTRIWQLALLCLCVGPPVDAGVIGAEGDLYVTSDVNSTVLQYDGTTGAFVGTFASDARLDGAAGLAFTSNNGTLIVVGYRSDNVLEYDGTTGAFVRVFTSGGQLDHPNGIALGPNGNVFISNWNPGNVLEFDVTTGAFVRVFTSGGGLCGPEDLVFGPNGNLFVTNTCSGSVIEYDGSTGVFVGVFASGAPLGYPGGLAFRPNGNVLVAEHNSGINKVFEYNGTSGALIGDFATVFRPAGIELGPNGNLFVAVDFTLKVEQFDGNTGAPLGVFASSSGLDRPYHLVFKPVLDGDGDGVNDADDACPDSDLSATIVIDGNDTGVGNCLFGDGCSLADLVAEVLANDPSTADIVQMLIDLKAAGLLTGQELGALLREANSP